MEDCFRGGVLTSGLDNKGFRFGAKALIQWDASKNIRAAYAITYRYGRPEPHSMYVNGAEVHWSNVNQAGPEQVETNQFSLFFAPHLAEINDLVITDDTLIIDFPPQMFYDFAWNWGWWGIYVIVLYEAPDLDEEICLQVYIADQNQVDPQNYYLDSPSYDIDHPLLFAFHSSRLSNFQEDATRIMLNGILIGDVWGSDSVLTPAYAGVQGHFAHDSQQITGLNGDVVNNSVWMQDGIAVINEYMPPNVSDNHFMFGRIEPLPNGGANPHPSFNLTYTPSCPVISSDAMPRSYTLCRGDSTVLQGVEGFEHYAWSPALQLSDSTTMNTTCTPDSSRWYRLRMWNDDAAQGCPLTIPVWVEVGQTPEPGQVTAVQSSCPASTGAIRFEDMAGTPPYNYSAGDLQIESPLSSFINLPPGSYPISITDALGCTWDSSAVIELNTPQTAAFRANPSEGVSPLNVYFGNQSTGADAYLWLIDGEPFSTSTNAAYTFADSGSYEVSLVAMLNNPDCADTASVIILVEPGIQLIVPNIFTPNGDGRNDRLVAQVLGARKLSWTVYNRWGNALHSDEASLQPQLAEALELWDGLTTAGQASDGSYMLVIVAEGIRGKVEKMQFTVQVTGAGR